MKAGLLAIALSICTSTSFAAVNMQLQIEDEKGKVTKVAVAQDGTFECPVMPAGRYKVKLVWDVGSQKARGATDDASRTELTSAARTPRSIVFNYQVKPRQDGEVRGSVGRRVDKPVSITKEIGKSNAQMFTYENIEFENECAIVGTISLKGSDGKPMAMDDWHVTK